MLPVLELDRLGIGHPQINLDVAEWQTHRRDIWLTDHECHLKIKVNISQKHSQARYIQHTYLPEKPTLKYRLDTMNTCVHSSIIKKNQPNSLEAITIGAQSTNQTFSDQRGVWFKAETLMID